MIDEGSPMSPAERAELERIAAVLTTGHCPECTRRGFVIGPQGGKSTMIECAYLSCRARFVAVFFSGECVLAYRSPKEREGGNRWPSAPESEP